ncbi:hypothetical protein GCM10010250_55780 [Streptomyces althioticus]|nr:hypothetical protein GCM10010250_55780 [Streptomyces althioticus]GGT29946.1 hypothetical protein GCM10010243_02920 [Streptomyces matensis]
MKGVLPEVVKVARRRRLWCEGPAGLDTPRPASMVRARQYVCPRPPGAGVRGRRGPGGGGRLRAVARASGKRNISFAYRCSRMRVSDM